MHKEYDFKRGRRGAVMPVPTGKTRITIRLDDDILEWFRGKVDAAGGGNYQTLINDALRHFIAHTQAPPLEAVVRQAVREELRRYAPLRPVKRRGRWSGGFGRSG